MTPGTRRTFFNQAAGLAATAGLADGAASIAARGAAGAISLNGEWAFRIGREESWRKITVPHTWQVDSSSVNHLGKASYRRLFFAPAAWKGGAVRVEFESVYHTARVAVNGRAVGEHIGKGYTAFTLDVTDALKFGEENELTVEVDNSFFDGMLPRNNSYDWTPDGGIYRPVWLHATPALYIERVEVDAAPEAAGGRGVVGLRAVLRNKGTRSARLVVDVEVIDDATGLAVAHSSTATEVGAGKTETVRLPAARIEQAKLWHFDHPNLYRVRVTAGGHSVEESFGIRRFEVKDGYFHLNDERVHLMGVERMAGSHPQFGMAEPVEWIEHDHRDMKELNCVFTRVHWMQDKRLLDWCDRNGMLMQLEVPTWGPATWRGMTGTTAPAILQNGLEQLREMIAQNRNHPCIFAWGLCNEIGGANPPAKQFAQAMYKEARRLDGQRLLSYASNTLHADPRGDVAGEMDILEWNEYYESWYGGDASSVREALRKIRAVYPNKLIVISEYGLCECDPKNPTSDERRVKVLESHDAVYREDPLVGGLIFFCYNDYRTHIGDKGQGVMKQRVHGVVDVYGEKKPSYEALRRESSPVETFTVTREGGEWSASVKTRSLIPAYTLRGYQLRWTVYAFGDLPMEQVVTALPDLKPGSAHTSKVRFVETKIGRVVVEIVRPTGSTVLRTIWRA
ncbi:MAG TPA: glycoside hydrolase family 2 TIM barrel-domain containing protein [Paludibaculum sp.]|jgi:beta-glucuronidase